MKYNKLTTSDIENLRGMIADPDRFVTEVTEHWDHDQLKTVRAMPELVIRPTTNEEVQQVVKYASDHKLPLVPRGNSTGLMGANLTVHGGISLDMVKMNKILEYEPESLIMTVQAGIRLKDIEEFLADKPLTYVPAPAMHWATIGGNVATNAGGLKAVKYGVTREHIRALRVVTEVTVKLMPRAKTIINALIPFPSLNDAIKSVPAILASGVVPTTVEFMGRKVLNLWESYSGKEFPVKDGNGFIIIGLDAFTEGEVKAELDQIAKTTAAFKAGKIVVLDAGSEQAKLIWSAREQLLLAIQKSTPKMDEVDVSVPINKIPDVLERIQELEDELGMRIPNFGHAGDGNLHIYICSDEMTDEEFIKNRDTVISELYKTAKAVDGNISGEHGVGYARESCLIQTASSTLTRSSLWKASN